MSAFDFQFAPLTAAALEQKVAELSATRSTGRLKFLVEAQPSWFTDEVPALQGHPFKILEWMEGILTKAPNLKNANMEFHSTYTKSVPHDRYPNMLVCHLEAKIFGRKAMDDERRYAVSVRTDNRSVSITPTLLAVRDAFDKIPMETWNLSLMPDGSKQWIRTFHRRPDALPATSFYCPTNARGARNRVHAMIGEFTGLKTVEEYYARWFRNISPVQEVMDGQTHPDQAKMMLDVIDFFANEHSDAEIEAFVESIKAREIAAGVSKIFPVPQDPVKTAS